MHLDKVRIPELLLDCLGRKNPEEVMGKLQGAGNDDWQELLELAQHHGVTPLLYFRLKSFFSAAEIPSEILEQFRDGYLKNAGRNTLLFHGLAEILSTLAKAGIPVILLKGAYFAENVYSDIALRPMQDVDILLLKDDLQQGEKALKGIGYSASRYFLPGVDTDNYQHLLPLQRKNSIPIEVHWHLGNPEAPFRIDLAGVWERARGCRAGGQETKALCPEDMLLYLCIHCAYQHNFEMGLVAFCDIRQILERFENELDWDAVFARASEWGCERCLFLAFLMIRELLGVSLPGKVKQQIESENIDQQIVSAAYAHLFSSLGGEGLAPSLPKVMESEGLGEKVSVVVGRIFPGRKEMARLYPVAPDSPKVFLYYPVRFRDLLVRYGRGFWKMFAGDQATLDSVQHRMKGEELRQWMGEK